MPGRSELPLEACLQRLQGKSAVQLLAMDLSATYRSIVRKYFPNARIVAYRFPVIRLVNHHFLLSWRDLDPTGSKNRGLLKLMRRHEKNLTAEQAERLSKYLTEHPAIDAIYGFKQKLCALLTLKKQTKKQCRNLVLKLLNAFEELRASCVGAPDGSRPHPSIVAARDCHHVAYHSK